MRSRILAALICLVCAALPETAQAHLIQSGLGPVYDGMLHCLLTPTNIVSVLALAILTGMQGAAHVRPAMFVLPAAWLVGGWLGLMMHTAIPATDWIPLLLLGALCAADLRLPVVVTTLLAAALGAYLGYSDGTTMVSPGPGVWGLLGESLVVFIIVSLLGAWVVSGKTQVARIAARVAGSWIAASGLLMLGWTLR